MIICKYKRTLLDRLSTAIVHVILLFTNFEGNYEVSNQVLSNIVKKKMNFLFKMVGEYLFVSGAI